MLLFQNQALNQPSHVWQNKEEMESLLQSPGLQAFLTIFNPPGKAEGEIGTLAAHHI